MGLKKKIETYINNNGLSSKVIMYGAQSKNRVNEFYKSAFLTIVPSVSEGFGLVAVEAILAGCTVLASRAGGLNEIIVDGLNGFNYSNEREMISKLIAILDGALTLDPRVATEFTYGLFSMEKVADKYRNLIDQI